MRLNKNNVIKVLSKNFGYKVVTDEYLGEMIAMNPYDAYIYSAVTSHGYLDNTRQPFTPNGLMQVFNQANAYNLVTGMFDRDGNLFHTPLRQADEMSFIKEGEKYILPIEYDTNANLQKRLKEIESYLKKQSKNPHDYIICRIKKSTGGYSMEPFLEYVATKYFNRHGLLTETQIPFYYSGGTPDFAAYSLPDIEETIKKYLKFSGISFIGLASIRIFPNYKNGNRDKSTTETIVGEAKTAATEGVQQIEKYLRHGVFSKAYEIIPHKESPEVTAGLFTFDDEGVIQIFEAQSPAKVIPEKQKEYILWLGNYIKFFLIANLTNEELDEVYGKITKKKTRTVDELISFVSNLSLEELLNIISKYIYGK